MVNLWQNTICSATIWQRDQWHKKSELLIKPWIHLSFSLVGLWYMQDKEIMQRNRMWKCTYNGSKSEIIQRLYIISIFFVLTLFSIVLPPKLHYWIWPDVRHTRFKPEVSSHDRGTGWGHCHCQVPGPDTSRSSESFSAVREGKKNVNESNSKTKRRSVCGCVNSRHKRLPRKGVNQMN